ncbi:MAG: nucleotidyltransferase family protein [Candidatus Woesearchaeota archaeon]|jgi:NDP-sugar pyrophosphorylase family protein
MVKTAIILAGGMGTRLRPLTNQIPKPLIPIGDKPLLQHIIDNFRKYEINNIILCVGYKAEQIEEYFGNGESFGVKISYSRESLPLGTGGAIKQAAKNLNGPLFMQWGDNLMDLNWNEVEKEYLKNKTPVLMVLTPREDVENF